MAKPKKLADTIFDMISGRALLPGQGAISSGRYEECTFSILAKECDDAVNKYWDILETKCLALLSTIKPDAAVFNAMSIAQLNNAVHNRCEVLISETAVPVIEQCGKFRPARHKNVGGNTKYVGRLGWAKVYVNPYVKPAEAYVIDRTVIDLSHTVEESNGEVHITVRVRTNEDGIAKYLLTSN